jgi:hypothetical protein
VEPTQQTYLHPVALVACLPNMKFNNTSPPFLFRRESARVFRVLLWLILAHSACSFVPPFPPCQPASMADPAGEGEAVPNDTATTTNPAPMVDIPCLMHCNGQDSQTQLPIQLSQPVPMENVQIHILQLVAEGIGAARVVVTEHLLKIPPPLMCCPIYILLLS